MSSDRVSEPDLVIPALRAMAARPNGFISTTDLIGELERIFQPTGRDAEIIPERSDTYFSQKVRNLVSHRTLTKGGAARYDNNRRGYQITDIGTSSLRQVGP
jgi:hypothetical protein